MLGVDVFDPRMPDIKETVLDQLDPELYRLYALAESKDVRTVTRLLDTFPGVAGMINDPRLRPEILKLLHWRRNNASVASVN